MGDSQRRANHEDWVLLCTAPNQIVAEMLRERLDRLLIPACLAPTDVVSFLGVASVPCRVLVPARFLAAARQVLERGPP
ncbi:MAG: hypothetical protein IRZ14_08485 [Chloroflexi bacterium]|nr:hypothetical protein [Chloroflexota bacterium]